MESAMPAVISDRYTTHIDHPFVVFLIGMRINKPLSVRKWLKVANAMPPMIETLYKHPEKGFLGGESFVRFFPLQTILISYWRSFEDIERFARSKDDPHLAAWHTFNREIGYSGEVGIWHETYAVQPGAYEALYGNMPLFGLARATGKMLPVTKHQRRDARVRMRGEQAEPLPAELVVYE
jgi:Domain of unknown function (DUF4188)